MKSPGTIAVFKQTLDGNTFKLTCTPTSYPLLKKAMIPMPGDVFERDGQRWEVIKVVGYQPAKRTLIH